ncbi:MAG: SDR family NAD(P)-dependent oxidoreductase [Prolixibacteraceae bacterium]|nr:SDR family NAD(P)-dependent oxidoreductase [Prolixibacteraceae bacterium]
MLKNFVLITGASKGLGLEFACEYARLGRNLLLVALPGEGLEDICAGLSEEYIVKALYLETDLTQNNSVYEVAKWAANYPVDTLVNNAGLGGAGFFDKVDPGFMDSMIMLNVRSVAMLTRLVLPLLLNNKKGYIINVSSLAAFSPMTFKLVYPASKTFVYSISRSLHEELRLKNINVTVVHPGPMNTNKDVRVRMSKLGPLGRMGLVPVEKVAHVTIRKNKRNRPVYIPGIFNKLNWLLMKIVPLSIVLFVVSKVFKKEFN